jgi:hypothetical protein
MLRKRVIEMKTIIHGTLRKIEYRCAQCGRWTDRGFCEDHPNADSRVYHSYELDDDVPFSETRAGEDAAYDQ